MGKGDHVAGRVFSSQPYSAILDFCTLQNPRFFLLFFNVLPSLQLEYGCLFFMFYIFLLVYVYTTWKFRFGIGVCIHVSPQLFHFLPVHSRLLTPRIPSLSTRSTSQFLTTSLLFCPLNYLHFRFFTWEKLLDTLTSVLDVFHLAIRSQRASIFLQMTQFHSCIYLHTNIVWYYVI